MLRSKLLFIISLSVLLVGGIALWAVVNNGDNEENVPLKDVPDKVKDAANSKVPGGVITVVTKEVEGGVLIYDVVKVVDDKTFEIEVTADGVVNEVDNKGDANDGDDNDKGEEIALFDVPDNVKAAATKAVSDGKIVEAEKKDENGEAIYEVDMVVKYEVTVTAKGEVKKVEIDKEDDDGDNDKDDGEEDDD